MPDPEDNLTNPELPGLKDRKSRLAMVVSAVGILVFLFISVTFSFRDQLFAQLFPKPPSHAQVSGGSAEFLVNAPNCALPDEEFSVPLLVKNPVDEANLFSAKINFATSSAQVVRIEKTPTFITQWVETTYDNNTGKISIIGGVPDPGFKTSGTDGNLMANVVFKATSQVGANINIDFENTSVIYRNSDNVDILGTVTGASLAVNSTCTRPSTTPVSTSSPGPSATPANQALTSFNIVPTGTTHAVGEEFPARLFVRSDTDAANLFSARFNFNTDILSVVRIEKTPSFITNWVETVFNNSSGEVSIVGGVPNPGFGTTVGTADALMATIIFKGEATGSSQLQFNRTRSAIYRNSDNADILGSVFDSMVNITTATSSATPTPGPTSAATTSPTNGPAGGPGLTCSFTGPTTLTAGQVGNYNSTSTGQINTTYWSASGGLPTSGVNSSFGWSSGVPGTFTIALTVIGPSGQQTCNTNVAVSAPAGGPGGSSGGGSSSSGGKVIPKGPPVAGRAR